MPLDFDAVVRGWCLHADALAAWTDARLVNRRDVWGAYLPAERREPDRSPTYTAPARAQRGHALLGHEHLVRHYRGERVYGLHSTSATNESRWGAHDVDVHEPTPDLVADAVRRIGRLLAAYRERGVVPLVEDACGRGGGHLWIVLSEPAPTADVFAFLQDVQHAAGLDGETFPKQPRLTTGMLFGNWLRLPGRHHTRSHWSRIAAGGKWRSGSAAARAILEHPLTPAALIPSAPPPPARPLSWPSLNTSLVPRDRATRVMRYLDALPHGLRAGEQRSDVAFNFGRFLVFQVGCSDSEALTWLRAWNQRNATALADVKLSTTLANVHRYCRGAA